MPTLTQAEYSNLKRRLTTLRNKLEKATNAEDKRAVATKIVGECNHADAVFERKGYPDQWSAWTRAKDDARTLIQRVDAGLPV